MNWYDRHKDGWILKACCSFKWQTAMVLSLFPPSRLLHSFVRAFCSSSHHSIHQWCWGQIWRQASPPVFYFTLALSPCCSFVKTVSCAKYDKTNSEKGYYFFSSFFFFSIDDETNTLYVNAKGNILAWLLAQTGLTHLNPYVALNLDSSSPRRLDSQIKSNSLL